MVWVSLMKNISYAIHTRECDEQTKTCRRSNKNVHMLLAFAYHTLMTTLHLSSVDPLVRQAGTSKFYLTTRLGISSRTWVGLT